MSLIINIETSGRACSVALSKNDQLLSKRCQIAENYPHARILHVFIDEILKENGVKSNELSAVAVSSGPGSYTGLRIGVAAAKGLCFALEIPLIEISTLWLIARQAKIVHPDYDMYLPMIDARRMEVYQQSFDKNLIPINQVSPEILSEDWFTPFTQQRVLLCGDGSAKCKDLIMKKSNLAIAENIFPLADNMCTPVFDKYEKKEFVNVNYFEPFYLKEFQSQSVFHKK